MIKICIDEISKEERLRFVNLIKDIKMTIVGTRGYNEAIITQGGISIKDINPSADGWEELKADAAAVTENQQSYYFLMGNYGVFVDLAKEEVTFTEVE